MRSQYRIIICLISVTVLFVICSLPVFSKAFEFVVIPIPKTETYYDKHFYAKYDITPHSQEEDNTLASYASITGTEYSNAASCDIKVQTFIADEMGGTAFSNLYTQAAYVSLEIVLAGSNERFFQESAVRYFSDGTSCEITAESLGDFNEKDTIKYYASKHRIFIGLPQSEADYPVGHPNNTEIRFVSPDYLKYN